MTINQEFNPMGIVEIGRINDESPEAWQTRVAREMDERRKGFANFLKSEGIPSAAKRASATAFTEILRCELEGLPKGSLVSNFATAQINWVNEQVGKLPTPFPTLMSGAAFDAIGLANFKHEQKAAGAALPSRDNHVYTDQWHLK